MHRTASKALWAFRPEESPSDRGTHAGTLPGEHRKLRIISVAVLVAVLSAAITFVHLWPFTRKNLTRRLHQHTSATIEFGSFRRLYFPQPGFLAEHVVIRRTPSSQPAISIGRLTVLGTWSGLVGPTKSISLLKTEDLVATVFAGGAAQNVEFHRSTQEKGDLVLEHLLADGSTVQVSSPENAGPLVFRIFRLRMNDLGATSAPGSFDIALQNPKPTMQIAATGKLGPWRSDKAMLTPVAGSFSVSRGDLSSLPALHGKLTSSGQFKGDLTDFEISGHADVPDFEVQSLDHPMPLHVRFDSAMNTSTSRLTLRSIDAQLAATDVQGSGMIFAGKQQSPDFADLMLHCEQGRVDDLLRLFTSSPTPSMVGPIRFNTAIHVQRGNRPFLERVLLSGNFAIKDAQFTSPVTQYKLNKLSARSEGNPEDKAPPERAITLSGHVEMRDGVAHLSDTRFQVPGAYASGGGTYNVLEKRVNLQGRLRMEAELSEASKGVKSVFLKLLDPIFKKRGAGAVVPVHVTGTSQHAEFKASLK